MLSRELHLFSVYFMLVLTVPYLLEILMCPQRQVKCGLISGSPMNHVRNESARTNNILLVQGLTGSPHPNSSGTKQQKKDAS